MPSAEAPTSGRVISKVASAPEEPAGGLARARALELLLELVHAAQQVVDRDPAVVEDDLGRLRRADAELVLLLAHGAARRVLGARRRAWPRWPELGSTVATRRSRRRCPPFEMKTLVPLRTHSSPSSFAVGAQRLDVGARPASVTA
jgi:hypothetical protein